MIQVTNLSKAYGDQVLFRDVSFSINPRERIGLVGRNGHGKTTLLRLLMGEEEPDGGEILVPKNYRMGYLEQQIAFQEKSVLDEAALGLPAGQAHARWKAERILHGLGFTRDDFARPPAEMSGGFQVRLNLAKVLVSEPNLLLLDEPTNYLDIISIRWLTRFLRAWRGELVLVTHDRGFMDRVTTHTLGIHRQRVRKIAGDTEKLYTQIAQEEEIYEKTRVNDERRRKEIEQFIRRFRAKARLANLVQSRIKTLEKQQRREKLEKIESLEFSFSTASFPAKVMMEIRDLGFAYDGQPQLFGGLELSIGSRDRICVVGKNGKGKTTLLKVLAGVLPATCGHMKPHPSLRIGYFEQTNTAGLHPENTVLEEIMRADGACTMQKARDIAAAMMFRGDAALKKIAVLSGGEKSRVLLGRLLVTPCHLLLLDEPTNHLDMESCDSLLAAIDAFDGAVVLVTHNEMFLRTLPHRLLVFDRGKQFLYEGSYDRFLQEVGWQGEDEASFVQKSRNNREGGVTPAMDKKVLRKRKAALIQEKSRVLKPLVAAIQRLENEIERLEAEVGRNNRLLVEASTAGDGPAIARLAKTERELNRQLTKLYDELDAVTREHETRLQTFDKKLAELEP